MKISLRVLVLVAALAVSGAAAASPAAAGSAWSRQSAVGSPSLSSLRLVGGSRGEQGARVAVGGSGNVFLAGTTSSVNFPVPWHTRCAQPFAGQCLHAFIIKLNPITDHVYYSAVFAGSRSEQVSAVAVDGAGNAYLAGTTTSYDFPTVRPLQPTCGDPRSMNSCSDGFVIKLDPRGRVVYSTYLGGKGDDQITGIAANRWGEAYVTGSTTSPNFPIQHALQPRLRGKTNAFVARIDRMGSRLLYSTYLGGSKQDGAAAIAVDRWGQAFVTGGTVSPDLPTSAHAVQPHFVGGSCTFFPCADAWVTKLGTAGRFLAGTYLGTTADDHGSAIALDNRGSVYVAGATSADTIPNGVPVTSATKNLCGSEGDINPCYAAFVVELSPWLDQRIYTQMFSGDGHDEATSITVSGNGEAFVGGYTESTIMAGTTSSTNFPLTKVTAPSVMPKIFLGRIVGVS